MSSCLFCKIAAGEIRHAETRGQRAALGAFAGARRSQQNDNHVLTSHRKLSAVRPPSPALPPLRKGRTPPSQQCRGGAPPAWGRNPDFQPSAVSTLSLSLTGLPSPLAERG